MKRGILFTDVDGTILFSKKYHGISDPEKKGEIYVANALGKEHEVLFAVTHRRATCISKVTYDLAHQLRRSYSIICVTGAGITSIEQRRHVLDFADGFILENGAAIVDASLQSDEEWSSRMGESVDALERAKSYLNANGWNIDIEGMVASIRVRPEENKDRKNREFENLCQRVPLDRSLRKTTNMGYLDIFPAKAGKGQSAEYYMRHHGYDEESSIAVGDDVNDVAMLSVARKKFVLGSAHPLVLDVARKHEWYVSNGMLFDGINEILLEILKTMSPKQDTVPSN